METDDFGFILFIFMLSLMWAVTIVTAYRRRNIFRGRLIYTSGKDLWAQVGGLFHFILAAVPTVFFMVILLLAFRKGIPDVLTVVSTVTAILFFGMLANTFAPWRSQTVITDRGIIYPMATGGWYWRQIRDVEWTRIPNRKSYQLTIHLKLFGFLSTGIPLRGDFDTEKKQEIENLLIDKPAR